MGRRRQQDDHNTAKPSPFSRLGPPTSVGAPAPASESPTPPQERRYAAATTTAAAPLVRDVPSPTRATFQCAARGTPPRSAPSATQPKPHPARTPLRHSQFESELALHPDKTWVSWLLDGINNGVRIGYSGDTDCPSKTHTSSTRSCSRN